MKGQVIAQGAKCAKHWQSKALQSGTLPDWIRCARRDSLEAIALGLEAIALGLEAMALRLEAIFLRLEAIAN